MTEDRISSSFERRGRASSHTNASRERTPRYTNDQSKQPSLDHNKTAQPYEPGAHREPQTSCEPYAIVTADDGTFGLTRMWRTLAGANGVEFDSAVFRSFEEARAWLETAEPG